MTYLLIIGSAIATVLLFLLAAASSANTTLFGEHYPLLLAMNGVIAAVLIGLVVWQMVTLWRARRAKVFGSLLTFRVLVMFAIVAMVPGAIVYTVSVQFLTKSIESWFDVRVDKALEGGLDLGRSAIDSLLADLRLKTRSIAIELSDMSPAQQIGALNRLREQAGAEEALLMTASGKVVGGSSRDLSRLLPPVPSSTLLRQARGGGYSAVEPDGGNGLLLRVIAPVNSLAISDEGKLIQFTQHVPQALAESADSVQEVYHAYKELSLSRQGLKLIYILTLTLTLLLTLSGALALAFLLSRRLSQPLAELARGTQAVARGDFSVQMPVTSRDELGILTQSFNSMTRQLDEARQANERARAQVETARAYLESVLANLSAGVLVFDAGLRLNIANRGAENILRQDFSWLEGRPLEDWQAATGAQKAGAESGKDAGSAQFDGDDAHAKPDGARAMGDAVRSAAQAMSATAAIQAVGSQTMGAQAIGDQVAGDRKTFGAAVAAEFRDKGGADWQRQLELPDSGTVLLLRGSSLPATAGYVLVFDDITQLVAAERATAWGEVARRLAHEIKNPLTPIQLSAERLEAKLSSRLPPTEAAVLSRAVETIVSQVTAMKNMVDDFREYARTPAPQLQPLDLNQLIGEVLALYENAAIPITARIGQGIPQVRGDPTQIRQVIHNLLSNAQDALAGATRPRIEISTELAGRKVWLKIRDNGGGFPEAIMRRAFEPYVTTKPKGTGLGLAIVKKIIDEHHGTISIENHSVEAAVIPGSLADEDTAENIAAGATVSISLPLAA